MMIIDAIIVTIVGLLLVAVPNRVLEGYVLIRSDVHLTQVITYLAIVMVGLGVHQATTSRYAGDPAFRRTTLLTVVLKLVFAFALAHPNGMFISATRALAIQSGLFAFLYLVTLPIKSIGYKEEK